MLVLVGCSNNSKLEDKNTELEKSTGTIYLYGERHGSKSILEKELELWGEHYNDDNMRHLFIESSYFNAEFLNFWMKSDDDIILDELYEDWKKDSAAQNPYLKEFFENIKINYPETIFHGTDLGHRYNTTGKRFLEYLENNNLEGTDKYLLTQEAIKKGEYYNRSRDFAYRENKMTENFIQVFDQLKNEDIMGIYGAGHTNLEGLDYSKSVPTMGSQLKKRYGDSIYSESLVDIGDNEPASIDIITVEGREYEAWYFGKFMLSGIMGTEYEEIWRLENSYEDFKGYKKTGKVYSYTSYPMSVEIGQVFVVDYIKKDGSVERSFYRSDGLIKNGVEFTEEFKIE